MAEASGGLRVPKTAVCVDLALDGGVVRRGEVYVAGSLSVPARREHVIELLLAPDDFLPVRDALENVWNIVNKGVLLYVSVPLAGGDGEDDAGLDDELFDVRCPVELHLVGGIRLVGELLYSPPVGRARVTDYLNDSTRFVRLWTTDAVYFVQRRYIARVIER
jgi:hypothetical protein